MNRAMTDVTCTNDMKHQTQKSTLKKYSNNSKQQVIPIIIAFSNLKWCSNENHTGTWPAYYEIVYLQM